MGVYLHATMSGIHQYFSRLVAQRINHQRKRQRGMTPVRVTIVITRARPTPAIEHSHQSAVFNEQCRPVFRQIRQPRPAAVK